MVFVHTKDIAKFGRKVVGSDEKWSKVSKVVGDSLTFNEILEVTEKARGKYTSSAWIRRHSFHPGTKFDIVHDSLEDLRAGKVTEIPAYVPLFDVSPKESVLEMMAAFRVAIITGAFYFEGQLSNDEYSEIQPVKVRDFIKEQWRSK